MKKKKVSKYFQIISIFIIIINIISCVEKNNNQNSNYSVVDSIIVKSDDIMQIYSLQKIETNFVCINFLDRINIILFNENGDILSSYHKKGKGPKEILRAQYLTVYENSVYILDSGNNKLLILDNINNQLKYNGEFKIDSQPMDITVINKDRILISNMGEYNLSLYNKKGKLLNNYSINSKKGIDNMEDFLSTALNIQKFSNSNKIVLASLVTGNMTFCEFDSDSDSLGVLETIQTEHKVTDETDVIENKKKEQTTINLNGLKSFQCLKNNCYISNTNPKLKHSFEVYDKDGIYKGLIDVVNVQKDIYNCFFSKNSETLWFMKIKDCDNIIYIAKNTKGRKFYE